MIDNAIIDRMIEAATGFPASPVAEVRDEQRHKMRVALSLFTDSLGGTSPLPSTYNDLKVALIRAAIVAADRGDAASAARLTNALKRLDRTSGYQETP